jgi:hypothetical protein
LRRSCYSSLCVVAALSAVLMFAGCSSTGSNPNSANNANSGGSANPSSSAQPESSASPAPAESAPAPEPVTIPAGTEIHVILDTAVSSRNSAPGDNFDATVSEPVMVRGRVVIRRDARARGVVVDARPSGRLSKPALLSIELRSVQSNGAWVPVRTRSLTMEGKSHKKRDIVAIGGGSALGAIIGGIAGGGKGAAIGAAAGGGAGTAGAAITGKKDITLPAESHLAFRLARSATVQMQ